MHGSAQLHDRWPRWPALDLWLPNPARGGRCSSIPNRPKGAARSRRKSETPARRSGHRTRRAKRSTLGARR
eukprot:14285002-Alexandrium_andersonii.AAC.1